MTARTLIKTIARKEITEIIRDGRLRLLGGIVVVLAIAALVFGVQQTERAQHAREHAQERSDKQWENQGQKNPHVAAHYGTHVFAPTSAATAIDPGVTNYMGRSIKMEAHRRNLATHSAAQDSSGLQRLGAFSVATVLLQLVPLLIIALGYGLWSLERERGTLRQLLSTEVQRSALFWGKAIALFSVIGALLIPAGLIIAGALWTIGGGDSGTLLRLGLLAALFGTYYAIFGGLTLYASARAKSSRAALVTMIGLWGLFCLVAPRGAAELSANLRPLPSQAELAQAVSQSLEKGVDGTTSRDTAVEAIASDLMAEQGMADTGLMVDQSIMNGIELQAEAAWEDMVFDHHITALNDQIADQEQVASWLSFLSPYVAMRAVSAGLCGTDFAHHRHFSDYAESWRKALVTQLNTAFSTNAGAEGWDYKAGPEVWKNAPAFQYAAPRAGFALQTHMLSIIALGLWLILAIGLALWSARRVRVV